MAYFAEIIKWDKRQMQLYINLTIPEHVSAGFYMDVFVITKIKDEKLFTSQKTGKTILDNEVNLREKVLRQVPKDVDAEQIEETAQSAKRTMTAFLIFQIIC